MKKGARRKEFEEGQTNVERIVHKHFLFLSKNPLGHGGKSPDWDVPAANTNAFMQPLEMGGGVQSGLPAARAENRLGHGCDAPLSIGAGYVEHRVSFVGVAESLHHGFDPVQTEMHAVHFVAAFRQKGVKPKVVQGLGEEEIQGINEIFPQVAAIHDGIDHAMFH